FLQAEDGIRDFHVTGVQTCALPISRRTRTATARSGWPPRPPRSTRTGSATSRSCGARAAPAGPPPPPPGTPAAPPPRSSRCGRRSEEHTSELQSRENLVCRLLLEKK